MRPKEEAMTNRTNTPKLLDNPPIPVQAKLAAAWGTLIYLILYIDYFHLYQPGEIDDIRGGFIFAFDISGGLISIFFVIIAIPGLMVMLSMALPARVSRATNLVVASLQIPLMVFNIVGSPSDFVIYYILTIGVELLILAFILRSAWTWPRASAVTAGRTKTDLRQSA